jgi:DNA polymerase-3 subunit beta
MKIHVDRDALLKALALVASVLDRRAQPAAFACVWLASTSGLFTLRGRGDRVQVSAICPALEELPGEVFLPGGPLLDIVKALPTGELALAVDEKHRARITSGSCGFLLPGLSAKNNRYVERGAGHLAIAKVRAGALRDMLRRTLFAVCRDITRYHINGLYLRITGDEVVAAATDGHRLVEIIERGDAQLAGDLGLAAGAVLPAEGLKVLSRLLRGVEGDVLLETCVAGGAAERVIFRVGPVSVALTPIKAEYPDYRGAVAGIRKAATAAAAVVDRAALLAALKRAAALCGHRSRAVICEPLDGRLYLKSVEEEGTFVDSVPAELLSGATRVGVNVHYLRQALEAIPTPRVRINWGSGSDGFLLTPDGAAHRHTHSMMPINIYKPEEYGETRELA